MTARRKPEEISTPPESTARKRPHTQSRLYKHCVALAQRRNFVRSLQLIFGQAHRVQERVPALVVVEIREERIFAQTGQTRVALPARTLQPFESAILITAIRVSFRNLICGCLGVVFD